MWVYPKQSTSDNWSQKPIFNITGSNFPFYLSLGDSSNNYFIGFYNTNWKLSGNQTKSSVQNKWQHVILTWNGNIATLYINGQQVSQTTSYTSFTVGSKTIGGEISNNRFANAQIDDVRIYNYALTDEQVKQVYNGGAVNFQ